MQPVEVIRCTPQFDREAGLVMNSPYWAVPRESTLEKQLVAVEKQQQERALLRQAILRCRTYNDLQGKVRAIYDKAKAALKPSDR